MLPRFVGRVSEDRKQYGGNDIGCEQPTGNRSSIIPHRAHASYCIHISWRRCWSAAAKRIGPIGIAERTAKAIALPPRPLRSYGPRRLTLSARHIQEKNLGAESLSSR